MLKIFKHLKLKEWIMIIVSLGFVTAQVWFDLRIPDYMSEVTTTVTTPGGVISDIWRAGGMMLLCTLGSIAMSIIVGYFAARVASTFSYRLRASVFSRVESFSMEEINGFSTASLITRTTNDITQIQMIVAMGMQVIIRAPITAGWALAKMSTKNWEWTALTGGLVIVMIIVILSIMTYAIPRFRRIQTLTDNINRVTRENLTGIRVVRAYNAEKYEEAKFEQENTDLTNTHLSVMMRMQLMNPTMRMVTNGLSLGIFWIGAYLIQAAGSFAEKGEIFSNMVVFSQYALQVVMSFTMLTMIFIMLPRVAVSIRRVNEVLDTEPTIRDGSITASQPGKKGEIEFKNVSFKYPDAEDYVLHDISFKVNSGETVAFIGSTGSGKSTLINLVPRFYDATDGSVLIDGVDVRDYTQETLRKKLGYVPQRAVLFSGNVTGNVAFGDSREGAPPDEAEVRRAVTIAQGADFVDTMPGGYDAVISQGGTNVSGGQKQRLAIARAVYRQPDIFIFDDSFSALDYKTDRVLRSVLRKETENVTSLIVAQRIGTIRDADKIVVLDEGRIVGIGTHNELMKSCEVYQEIAYSQLSKEELGA